MAARGGPGEERAQDGGRPGGTGGGRAAISRAPALLVLACAFVAAGGPGAGPRAGDARARPPAAGGPGAGPSVGDEGAGPTAGAAAARHAPRVRPGIAVLLEDSLHLVRGRRVGLITNHTGLGPDGRPGPELLAEHPDVELAALFSPEHGLEGLAGAGEAVVNRVDPGGGAPAYMAWEWREHRVPVRSLYGATRKPTAAMLEGLDALLFDIQDVGARYYTYVSTMALAMHAAAEEALPFVVLDRPDPVGGHRVQGNVLDTAHASFVGMFPVAMRHGMTVGELARMINDAHGVGARLHVVPAAGWRRDVWLDETGLPWLPPSPNMRTLATATVYPGTCLFEGTNLSVGRGTARPFEQVGAPWLDGEALAEALQGYRLPGVRFEAVTFTPRSPGDGKYDGRRVGGVRLVVTDRERFDPTVTGVALLVEARRLAGDRWAWRRVHFDRLAGTARLRRSIEAGDTVAEIVAPWEGERRAFEERRRRYLIYPPLPGEGDDGLAEVDGGPKRVPRPGPAIPGRAGGGGAGPADRAAGPPGVRSPSGPGPS